MTKSLVLLLFSLICSIACAQETKLINTPSGTFPIIDEGEGTPILLLHGFPDTKELWTDQVAALVEAGYRVIAPDLRGYGDAPSPLEKEKYAMPILMNDVIEIIDEIGLDNVHLIGHDWGAVLSWQLAMYYEHRFISLTALSVGYPGNSAWSSMEQKQKSWYFYLFLQERLAEKTFADYDWAFANEFLGGHKNKTEIIKRFQVGNALTTALNWYRGNMQNMVAQPNVTYEPTSERPAANSKRLELPVLGVWSDKDFALSESQMKQSSESAINFTYKKIEDAGHWMMLDQPEVLNAVILDFLKSQE